jgi:hypothetical protein
MRVITVETRKMDQHYRQRRVWGYQINPQDLLHFMKKKGESTKKFQGYYLDPTAQAEILEGDNLG